MKCPLLWKESYNPDTGGTNVQGYCLLQECAWWDEVEGGRCAILSLVGSLDDIATKLMHIDEGITKLVNDELRRYSRG